MRLKSINVYTDYLGDSGKTKARTRELRLDSDFLDYVFYDKIKYVNNSYLKQLNMCCSSSVLEICIQRDDTEGYPEVAVPFDYSQYVSMSEEEKNLYWINTVEKVFIFLETKMKCQDDKLKRYITCLRESDIKMYKQKVTESYEVRGIY